MLRTAFISGFFFFALLGFSQEKGQVVRGTLSDQESHSRLMFASVALFRDSVFIKGATTDTAGIFKMEGIPSGRYNLQATYIGYSPFLQRGIEVGSGKEVVLTIYMEESVNALAEVVVNAVQKSETINEMTSGSTRIFSTEETQRYAGSRADIARMASNFAGVQGGDDSRNDIVIRGNSPLGVLWRVDDVDIPNPNHFAAPGTSGGPVSALNSKMFGASDFMTGAFAAEYGNATAGVFDLKMRSGNNEAYENTFQIGALGLELATEGPMSKKSPAPSYMFSYRYSTLEIFEKMNIPIGTSAVPHYQDAGLRLNLPGKNGKGNLSLFAIAGKSDIEIIQSKFTTEPENIYDDNNKDEYFGSAFAVGGMSYSRAMKNNWYARYTLSGSLEDGHTHHLLIFRDSLYKVDSLVEKLRYTFYTTKTSGAFSLSKKFNAKNTVKLGFYLDLLQFRFVDSIYHEDVYVWEHRMNARESTMMVQPYIQWKHKLRQNLDFNLGFHFQYFTLNGSRSYEPRAGLRWKVSEKQMLSLGYGMHSRTVPYYLYLIEYTSASGNNQLNRNLDFMRAQHLVLSHDINVSANARIKSEVYYQYLYNVPVNYFSSSYSMLNEGSSFDRIFPAPLVNRGTGNNYGIEFTYEKFFSSEYFILATASLFNSQYKGSDGIIRNTDFNGIFAMNVLAGKEFALNEKKTKFFIADFKVTYAGGGRYTPPDISASAVAGTLVENDSLRNTKQFRNYFRTDIKVGLKLNTKRKLSHELAIDLVNVFNTKNVLELSYTPDKKNPGANPLHEIYQLGRLPLFYYKIDF